MTTNGNKQTLEQSCRTKIRRRDGAERCNGKVVASRMWRSNALIAADGGIRDLRLSKKHSWLLVLEGRPRPMANKTKRWIMGDDGETTTVVHHAAQDPDGWGNKS